MQLDDFNENDLSNLSFVQVNISKNRNIKNLIETNVDTQHCVDTCDISSIKFYFS